MCVGLNHSEIPLVLVTWTGDIRNVQDNLASDHIHCDERVKFPIELTKNGKERKCKNWQHVMQRATQTEARCLSLVAATVTKEKWHFTGSSSVSLAVMDRRQCTFNPWFLPLPKCSQWFSSAVLLPSCQGQSSPVLGEPWKCPHFLVEEFAFSSLLAQYKWQIYQQTVFAVGQNHGLP